MSKKLRVILSTLIISSIFIVPVSADTSSIITIGNDLSKEQIEEVHKTFGSVVGVTPTIKITNEQEREYLEGIVPDAQIGSRTISCSYVELLPLGSGIEVESSNLTYVTTNMLSNALITSGIKDAKIIATAPFPVSGTGALTGILSGYEQVTGEELDEEKKEVANEELIITGQLTSDLGDEIATAIVNDVKKEVIEKSPDNDKEIAKIVNNIANNYNVNLNVDQSQKIVAVMSNINKIDYNFDDVKLSLDKISSDMKDTLKGTDFEYKAKGFLSKGWDNVKVFGSWVKDGFVNLFNWVKGLFVEVDKTKDKPKELEYDKDGNLIIDGNLFIEGEERTPEEIKSGVEKSEIKSDNPEHDTSTPSVTDPDTGDSFPTNQIDSKATEIDISESINIE